ncbi:hypothetical protein V6N13_115641 [Hibiscus sabdariffa]|uniref:Uncharacterized protein n=1 Tax=Hibiscus sabdariffa TaxID=183260 RepID=A0ABR2CSE4_9ROSI
MIYALVFLRMNLESGIAANEEEALDLHFMEMSRINREEVGIIELGIDPFGLLKHLFIDNFDPNKILYKFITSLNDQGETQFALYACLNDQKKKIPQESQQILVAETENTFHAILEN